MGIMSTLMTYSEFVPTHTPKTYAVPMSADATKRSPKQIRATPTGRPVVGSGRNPYRAATQAATRVVTTPNTRMALSPENGVG